MFKGARLRSASFLLRPFDKLRATKDKSEGVAVPCVAPYERSMVPGAGLEPARPYGQGILSPKRLPFRHPGARLRPSLAVTGLSVNSLLIP